MKKEKLSKSQISKIKNEFEKTGGLKNMVLLGHISSQYNLSFASKIDINLIKSNLSQLVNI